MAFGNEASGLLALFSITLVVSSVLSSTCRVVVSSINRSKSRAPMLYSAR